MLKLVARPTTGSAPEFPVGETFKRMSMRWRVQRRCSGPSFMRLSILRASFADRQAYESTCAVCLEKDTLIDAIGVPKKEPTSSPLLEPPLAGFRRVQSALHLRNQGIPHLDLQLKL